MRLNKEDYDKAVNCLKNYAYIKKNKEEFKREYQAVNNALLLVNDDSKYIFKELFLKKKSKWEILNKLFISEETYKRRKRELIYAVDTELKRLNIENKKVNIIKRIMNMLHF
jgi:hypothetical protein